VAETSRWNEPNLGPTETKRQHYVPQFYLRPFAGQDGNIRVADLEGRSEYRTSIKNVAVETHFYDLEVEGLSVSLEGWLARLEGEATPVIRRLIADPESIGSLSLIDELSFGRFLAALKFRTPAYREWEDNVSSSFLPQIKKWQSSSYTINMGIERQMQSGRFGRTNLITGG